MSIIVKNFHKGVKPVTIDDLTNNYDFPPRIATEITEELIEANLVSRVIIEEEDNIERGFQPAIDINKLSVASMLNKLDNYGATGFVPNFDKNFNSINSILDNIEDSITENTGSILIKDLDINIINHNK